MTWRTVQSGLGLPDASPELRGDPEPLADVGEPGRMAP